MQTPQNPTPSPDALLEYMVNHAGACSRSSKEMLGVELDFSPQSLQLVDQLLPIFHPKGFSIESVFHGYAAYVGEVVRKTLGGYWALEDDGSGASLRGVDNAATIYPFLWLGDRLEAVKRRKESQSIGEAYFRLLDSLGRCDQAPEELPTDFLCSRMGIDPSQLYSQAATQDLDSQELSDEEFEEAELVKHFDFEEYDEEEFDEDDYEDEGFDLQDSEGDQSDELDEANEFDFGGNDEPFGVYKADVEGEDDENYDLDEADDDEADDDEADDDEDWFECLRSDEFQANVDQLVEQLSTAPTEEQIRESLTTAPVNCFVLMASAAGEFDQAQVVAFANSLLAHTQHENPLVREFCNLAVPRFASDLSRAATILTQDNGMLLLPALLVISQRCAQMHAPQHARGFCLALLDMVLQVSSAAVEPPPGESRKFTEQELAALALTSASLGSRT